MRAFTENVTKQEKVMHKSFVFSFSALVALGACTANPDGTSTDTTTTTTTSHTTSSSHSGGSGGAGGSGGQGGAAPEVNELRWMKPAGYSQGGIVAAVAYTESGTLLAWSLENPLCILSDQPDGSYACPLVVDGVSLLPPGEDVFYTIFHEDVTCAPGGWIFDQGSYTCGACDGEQACCGKSFGEASITLGSVKLAQEPVLNGTASCVFNMRVHTSE